MARNRRAPIQLVPPGARKLNAAEMVGLQAAHERLTQVRLQMNVAEQQVANVLRACGLEPGVNYQIAEDGTVTIPAEL